MEYMPNIIFSYSYFTKLCNTCMCSYRASSLHNCNKSENVFEERIIWWTFAILKSAQPFYKSVA